MSIDGVWSHILGDPPFAIALVMWVGDVISDRSLLAVWLSELGWSGDAGSDGLGLGAAW